MAEVKIDRIIPALFNGTELAIDRKYGFHLLKNLLTEVYLVNSGMSYSDLGISDRRKESKTIEFLQTKSNQGTKIIDADLFGMFKSGGKEVPRGTVARLRLSGYMAFEGILGSTVGMNEFSEVLYFLNSQDIKGILIEGYTGGGELFAAQAMYNAVKDSKHKVITWGHYLASGGIMGTLASNAIYASSESSRFGSIGVYTSVDKLFLKFIKENYIDIYSKYSENKNKAERDLLNSDFEEGEPDVSGFLKLVDEEALQFQKMVKQNRPLSGNVEDTLKGGMFKASIAKSRGLIDGIATFEQVMRKF